MTVAELKRKCIALEKQGLGNKEFLMSDDDECNGFHTLFEGFVTRQDDIDMCSDVFHDNNDPKNVVLLV